MAFQRQLHCVRGQQKSTADIFSVEELMGRLLSWCIWAEEGCAWARELQEPYGSRGKGSGSLHPGPKQPLSPGPLFPSRGPTTLKATKPRKAS